MRAIVAGLALLAACSDPGGDCTDGTTRDPGPACTTRRLGIVVDGDPSEWASADFPRFDNVFDDAMMPGGVVSFQMALDGDDVALFLHTMGPPLPDDQAHYVVGLDEPGPTVSEFHVVYAAVEVGRDLSRWWLEFNLVVGLPVERAYSDAGVELRFPRRFLPHDGQVAVRAYASLVRSDGEFSSLIPRIFGYDYPILCWDPTRVLLCN